MQKVITLGIFLLYFSILLSQDLKPGILQDSIICKNSPEHTYALYLPQSFEAQKKWPVIFFFEPAARGVLPVQKYRQLGEDFGYILLGSNNSRNGPFEAGEVAYEAIMKDVQARTGVSLGFIITSGFSGGGRFAFHTALTFPGIHAVMACAGPKPSYLEEGALRSLDIIYAGLAGNKDMNYLEHLRFRDLLIKNKIRNSIFLDTLGHQWPNPSSFRRALEWVEMERVQNPNTHHEYFQERLKFIREKSGNNIIETNCLLEDLLRSMKNKEVPNNYDVADIMLSIEDKKKEFKAYHKIIDKEEEEQILYQKAIEEYRDFTMNPGLDPDDAQYNHSWWISVIKKLKRSFDNSNVLVAQSAYRRIDFLRGMFHNYYAHAITYNRFEFASRINALYIEMYPEAAWFRWNQAIVEAQKGNRRSAVEQLDHGLKLNTEAINQFRKMPQFDNLKKNYPWLFN